MTVPPAMLRAGEASRTTQPPRSRLRLAWLTSSLALLLALGALASPNLADAQNLPPQPEASIAYRSLTAVRINPLGLVNFTYASARFRLFESDSDILRQNFVGIGLSGAISPAWLRFGARVEFQPLTILTLFAEYQFISYFGTFDLFQSFETANADYSDSAIDELGDSELRDNYRTGGSYVTLGANFQIKLGPIAVRSLFRAYYTSSDMRDGDSVYYDQIIDTAMPDQGWVVVNDADVLAVLPLGSRQLAVGARYTYVHAFYRDEHLLAPGIEDAPNNDIHRLGVLAAFQLSSEPATETSRQARFDKPTLILLAQWHIEHRFRAGQDVSQALPYLGLAFSFEGDLLGE